MKREALEGVTQTCLVVKGAPSDGNTQIRECCELKMLMRLGPTEHGRSIRHVPVSGADFSNAVIARKSGAVLDRRKPMCCFLLPNATEFGDRREALRPRLSLARLPQIDRLP